MPEHLIQAAGVIAVASGVLVAGFRCLRPLVAALAIRVLDKTRPNDDHETKARAIAAIMQADTPWWTRWPLRQQSPSSPPPELPPAPPP